MSLRALLAIAALLSCRLAIAAPVMRPSADAAACAGSTRRLVTALAQVSPTEKLAFLERALAGREIYTCQANELLTAFVFSGDKLAVLAILAPLLVDKVRAGRLLFWFPVEDDRREARRLLGLR